jgi:methylmalonyl-CoA mutase cobalamin-binding subunit
MAVNEFVAYLDRSALIKAGALQPKTVIISSFALCGFANFSSIAIQVGGIRQLAPQRSGDLARLGLKALICGTLASYTRPATPPRVLLTTLPEEEHGLGLLMVEVMLASEGAQCCSLGPRMPLTDIRTSAMTSAADIVALSFSAAFPLRQALSGVRALRDSLPDSVDIWAGGGGAHERLASIPGVSVIGAIRTVPVALAEWRAARAPGVPSASII